MISLILPENTWADKAEYYDWLNILAVDQNFITPYGIVYVKVIVYSWWYFEISLGLFTNAVSSANFYMKSLMVDETPKKIRLTS